MKGRTWWTERVCCLGVGGHTARAFGDTRISSPGLFYSSVLSDGPIAHVDRTVIRAPVMKLPMVAGWWRSFHRLESKGGRLKGLNALLQLPGFYFKAGFSRHCGSAPVRGVL